MDGTGPLRGLSQSKGAGVTTGGCAGGGGVGVAAAGFSAGFCAAFFSTGFFLAGGAFFVFSHLQHSQHFSEV